MSRSGVRIGIDIGGTFTDVTLFDEETGRLRHHKVPSTPSDPALALTRGIEQVTDWVGAQPADVRYLVHGTTLALNTLLQRKGARVALVVSTANRHVLDLARLRLPEQFTLTPEIPKPLIDPGAVIAISGRILADGTEREPLDSVELATLADRLSALQVDACAIALLNSYVNPDHEQLVGDAIKAALPNLQLSLSSDVWPEIREYERTMVTTMNAYVAPQMNAYFAQLGTHLSSIGVETIPLITRSNGGLMSVDEAAQLPVETLISGPASGVVGAKFAAVQAGLSDCITFDMGGTSADVSVIQEGRPTRSSEAHVGDFPVVIPAVEVTAIGAGGGSIAWVDRAGVLKVGPVSAGAEPGPACYGRGGTEATVTDAYLACGFLDADRFASGQITLDVELAQDALWRLGAKLSIGAAEAAAAIVRIATATMGAQLSPWMASLGLDPHEFTLLPYGGAGPVHANLLAHEIGARRVFVPASPGTLCATGALINDLSRDWVRTCRVRLGAEALSPIKLHLQELDTAARSWIRRQPVEVQTEEVMLSLDMRYVGQAYELEVPLPDDQIDDWHGLARLFHDRHAAVHRHFDDSAAIEVINARVHAVGRTADLPSQRSVEPNEPREPSPIRQRLITLTDGQFDARIYERQHLQPGDHIRGPAVIEQSDTTTLVLNGYEVTVDPFSNLLIQPHV